jgi:hypothetical protein
MNKINYDCDYGSRFQAQLRKLFDKADTSEIIKALKILDKMDACIKTTTLNNSTNKFEFSYFKLTKLILVKFKFQTKNELLYANFNQLMLFCLNKCLAQYDLFKLSGNTTAHFNPEDEINVIEL